MTKNFTRLLAAATLCALPTMANAAVTYKLTSGTSISGFTTDISVSFTTAEPITTSYEITDFTGQTCSIAGESCTALRIDPTLPGPDGNPYTSLFLETAEIGFGGGYAGQALLKDGRYTSPRFTLTVSGIGDGVTPPTAAVPEPATWALMLAGFGLTGAALRRRRVRFARVAA